MWMLAVPKPCHPSPYHEAASHSRTPWRLVALLVSDTYIYRRRYERWGSTPTTSGLVKNWFWPGPAPETELQMETQVKAGDSFRSHWSHAHFSLGLPTKSGQTVWPSPQGLASPSVSGIKARSQKRGSWNCDDLLEIHSFQKHYCKNLESPDCHHWVEDLKMGQVYFRWLGLIQCDSRSLLCMIHSPATRNSEPETGVAPRKDKHPRTQHRPTQKNKKNMSATIIEVVGRVLVFNLKNGTNLYIYIWSKFEEVSSNHFLVSESAETIYGHQVGMAWNGGPMALVSFP